MPSMSSANTNEGTFGPTANRVVDALDTVGHFVDVGQRTQQVDIQMEWNDERPGQRRSTSHSWFPRVSRAQS